jgi:hypothetical protein
MDTESVRTALSLLSRLAEHVTDWAGYLEDSFARDGYIAGEFTEQDVECIRRYLLPDIERTVGDLRGLLEE